MNPENTTLGAIIPNARGRKIAYAVFSLVSFLVGNAAIYIAATTGQAPEWLIGATAILNNVAPIFGAVAIANAPSTKKKDTAVEVAPVVEVPVESVVEAPQGPTEALISDPATNGAATEIK